MNSTITTRMRARRPIARGFPAVTIIRGASLQLFPLLAAAYVYYTRAYALQYLLPNLQCCMLHAWNIRGICS